MGLTTPPIVKVFFVTETQTNHRTNTKCLEERSSSDERMTPGRENQQQREPTRPILHSPKQHTIAAAWNVRTMHEQGKTSMVAMEMKRYNISLLGIAATRWIQSGQFCLTTGEIILYFGHAHDRAPHTEGVGLMLSREAERALISWEPISSRLITAIFGTKQKRILTRFLSCAMHLLTMLARM